ncbi:MAG: hypothetical protein CSB55_02720 [Candidatus Cloacimonadota bacterium]|nr:MAG: hypothetical protein CSB55_02720 [Candidatus Cloacimonadota bacterium]
MKNIILIALSLIFVDCFGEFDLESFSNPRKYGWETYEDRRNAGKELYEKQKLLQLYHMNYQKPLVNAGRSALVPGWGHFAVERYTKGQILLGMEIIFAGTTFYYYDQYRDYYDKYEAASQSDKIQYYFDKAQTPYRLAGSFFGLYCLVWIYTVYDTFLVTDDYNGDIWDKIIKNHRESAFTVTPTGFSYRF